MTIKSALVDLEWLVGDQIRVTAHFFAGLVFFAICFSLSRYSAHIDRTINRGSRS
jgi:general L-amino acid transport system permease protein